MMNRKLMGWGLMAATLAACGQSGADVIRLNQVGSFPSQEKVAVANTAGVTDFTVVDAATGEEVMKGTTAVTTPNAWSPTARSTMDFSALDRPGTYLLLAGGDTAAFEIKDRPLAAVADAALKAFYYQRASMALDEPYAGPGQAHGGGVSRHGRAGPPQRGRARAQGR